MQSQFRGRRHKSQNPLLREVSRRFSADPVSSEREFALKDLDDYEKFILA